MRAEKMYMAKKTTIPVTLPLAESLKSFALYPAFIGSNCSEPLETVQKLMSAGLAVTAIESDDYSEISELKFM